MIQLLFAMIFSEMAVVLVLVFRNPLRKLAIMGLDRVKRGRGPIVGKTVAATLFVVLASSLYGIVKIHRRRGIEEDGGSGAALPISPTDQVLMAGHVLESTLMGSSLFLALMIDRVHHYIRELRIRRKSMEAVKKQNRSFEDGKIEEKKALEAEVAALGVKLKQLKNELEGKSKDLKASEVNTVALRKQSEGFLLEYDRLLEENQNLRSRLKSIDSTLSRSTSKKNS